MMASGGRENFIFTFFIEGWFVIALFGVLCSSTQSSFSLFVTNVYGSS